MDDYIELMHGDMLADGEMTAVVVEGHNLLVARVDGEFYVTDERCPHLHAHLSKGSLAGTVLTCPFHGSQFDLRDGSVVRWTEWSGAAASLAALTRHPRPLRTYSVELREGTVFAGPENPPPAEGAL